MTLYTAQYCALFSLKAEVAALTNLPPECLTETGKKHVADLVAILSDRMKNEGR